MIWDFDPVAFSTFGLSVRWYGLGYVASFFLVLHLGWWIWRQSELKKTANFSKTKWEDLLFAMFFGGIIGGRLGEFLFYSPETFWQNSLQVLQIWQGGMSIHGGILGSLAVAFWLYRKDLLTLKKAFDAIVIPLSLGLGLGRITNFINGELVGLPTEQNWGVIFPHIDNTLRHPSQLYEAASMFILSGLLWLLWKKSGKKISGFLTLFWCLGYGMFRFVVEFWKDSTSVLGSLTMGQVLCLAMIGIGTYGLINSKKSIS